MVAQDQPARIIRLGDARFARQRGQSRVGSTAKAQVARRFAQGCTSREIAAEFGVSLSTVHTQLASAYRKLGVSDKATLNRVLADSTS